MKIETVACSLYFNAWTLRFYSERSVFRLVSASRFKFSMARCSRLVIFFFKEKFRISVRRSRQVAWEVFSKAIRRPGWKNYNHKSFIPTVKSSFFNQITVNQSFHGALPTFRDFFLKEKFCVSAGVSKSLEKHLLSKAIRRPCRKNEYLRWYLKQIVHSNGKVIFL